MERERDMEGACTRGRIAGPPRPSADGLAGDARKRHLSAQECSGFAGCEGRDKEGTAAGLLAPDDLQPSDMSEEEMEHSETEEASAEVVEERSAAVIDSMQEAWRKKSESHNRKEQIRRRELKEAVFKLRNQLRNRTKKPSTISVLKAAQAEILDLTAAKERDLSKLDELKQKRIHLQLRLERLLDDNKGDGQGSTHHLSQLPCLPASSSTAPYPVPIVGVSHDVPSAPPPTPLLLVGQAGHPSLMVPPAPPLPPSLLPPQLLAPPPVNSHPASSLVMPFPANHLSNNAPPSHHAAIAQPCFPSLRTLRPPRGLAADIPSASSLPSAAALHRVAPKPPFIFTPQQPPHPHMPISLPFSVMHPFQFSGLMGVRNPALSQLPFAVPSQALNGGSGMVFSSPWGNTSADQRPVFPITLFSNHAPPSSAVSATAASVGGSSPLSSASHPPCPPLISPGDCRNLPSSSSLSPSPSPRLSSPPPLRSSSPVSGHTGRQACPHSKTHEEATPSASFPHNHDISRRGWQESSPGRKSPHNSSQIEKQREKAFHRFSFSDKQSSQVLPRPPILQDKLIEDNSQAFPRPPILHEDKLHEGNLPRPPVLQDKPHKDTASKTATISRKTSNSTQPLESPPGDSASRNTTLSSLHHPAAAETDSLQPPSQSKRRALKKKDPPLNDCEIIDYACCEKRARGREYHNSSSDSDSGGSCSSGQDGQGRRHRRCETAKRSSRRVATSHSNGNGTTTGSGKSSKNSRTAAFFKRRAPPLQVVEPEELLGDRDNRPNEGRAGFIVSLTSNCHISTNLPDEQLKSGTKHRNGTVYASPPALWKSKSSKERASTRSDILDKAGSHNQVGVSSKWMDDIIEKSVDNFKRKIFKLNSEFSDGGSNCSITQNPMTCSVVQ